MTNRMLPKYTDGEVDVFHPLCELVLNTAIEELGLSDILEVKHHEKIGSIESDFLVRNKHNLKYILIIEVKRTPTQVSSLRARTQAQSYVQESLQNAQQPYYLLTNLETSIMFKFDKSRPSVEQQVIEPGLINVARFKNSKYQDFIELSIKVFQELILKAYKDTGKYNEIHSTLLPELKSVVSNLELWHETVLLSSYDYIRGVMKANNIEKKWGPGYLYRNRPQNISSNLQTVDFEKLAMLPYPKNVEENLWSPEFSSSLYELGLKSKNGDELAELLHSILIEGNEHNGIVPTDIELANIVALLGKYVNGGEIESGENICDPAAGGGNLLMAALNQFHMVSPGQIWANDIEERFKEVLTLRLGLENIGVISPKNSPLITSKCLTKFNPSDFVNTKIVLLNPPYISGVKNPEKKREIANKISSLTGGNIETLKGQIGLEVIFLELVSTLIQNETVVAVVMPKQQLTNKGEESVRFREFLLNDFGLELIFTYSREGIFESVKKDTVVLVGKKGSHAEKVIHLHSNIKLSDINLSTFYQGIGSETEEIPGVISKKIKRSNLRNKCSEGWNFIYNAHSRFVENFSKINHGLVTLKDLGIEIKRGRVGNSGASDLIFVNGKKEVWESVKDYIPNDWLYPGLRRVNSLESHLLNRKTTDLRVLVPPHEAFIEETDENNLLKKIIKQYQITNAGKTAGRQKTKQKSEEELLSILKKEKKNCTPPHTILVPRNLRRNARCFITEEDCYVSTNVIELRMESKKQAKLLLSWILSLFGQGQFEYFSKDQEGARKTEINSFKMFKVPKSISNISYEKEKLDYGFRDFTSLSFNKSDVFWANYLNLSKIELEEVKFIIQEMINLRLSL